ncbi:hypothetical protein [Natronococcus occultus]|uniref:Uncharacterized protein n=1 Tax=Natronococcus occultus SP4 TaxID=694430 RepID=L0K0Y8_9EURY|nr:hypothetical protein [Natronococcus occultus]AGB38014.1 hypothetical protein Natoc_2236 [Natronococcus occultus SP4]
MSVRDDVVALSAVGLSVVMLAYLAAMGYDLAVGTPPWILFFVSVGGFAFVAALAVRSGTWTAVLVSVVVLALVPHLGDLGLGPYFLTFGAVTRALAFACVGGTVLIALEHAVRNRERVLESVSRGTIIASLGVGVGHLLTVVLVAEAAGDGVSGIVSEPFAAQPVEYAMLALVVTGLVALGAVPTLLYARWGLRLPAVVVAVGFALATVRTWRYVHDTVHLGASPSPMITYAVLWFVPFALALVVGGLEYLRIRGRSGRAGTPN